MKCLSTISLCLFALSAAFGMFLATESNATSGGTPPTYDECTQTTPCSTGGGECHCGVSWLILCVKIHKAECINANPPLNSVCETGSNLKPCHQVTDVHCCYYYSECMFDPENPCGWNGGQCQGGTTFVVSERKNRTLCWND